MTVPFYDPFPKYLQIREIILRWLTSFRPGDRLPTEEELAIQFNVSRMTIRRALHALEQDGIISRRPRLGTWLAALPSIPADDRLTGPIEEFAALGITTETHLAGQGIVRPSPDVAVALKIPAGDSAYEIRRVRILDGNPLLLLEAYFPLRVGQTIARRNLGGGLIVPTLRKILDPDIREEYQQIDAVSATKKMATLLKIEERDPLLSVKRLFVDSAGQPVVFFKTNFRADRYYYTVQLPSARERNGTRQGGKGKKPTTSGRPKPPA